MRILWLIAGIVMLTSGVARAAEPVKLYADAALIESGVLRYALPRFSLKTSIRVEISEDGTGDVALTARDGRALMAGLNAVWSVTQNNDAEHVTRFVDWLFSDIGKRTIFAFKQDGKTLFHPPEEEAPVIEAIIPDGDAAVGEKLALQHCGRCHVVSDRNKFAGIGSTPSFGALRTLPGWQDRFAAFWTLNPHPSFTQVEDMTEPFDPERPPTIAPVELTLDEAEAIAAFAATIEPKDLGAEIFAQ